MNSIKYCIKSLSSTTIWFALTLLPTVRAQARPLFWFADVEPVHHSYPPDYMELFAPNAAWPQAESRLGVFKISAETVLHGSDDMIRTIFGGMRAHGIAMAVEMGSVLQQPSEMCGGGEGYMQSTVIERLGTRLRALGFSLDYVAIDSPVWFGRERSWGVTKGRPDCQYSLDEIVHRASQTVAMMRQYFPAIRVGEIEAVNTRLAPGPVLADYAAFARGMRAATGQGLAFFHCDTAWQFPGWRAVLPRLQAQSHALGMRFGVIVGGSPEDATDEAWVEDGLQKAAGAGAVAGRRGGAVLAEAAIEGVVGDNGRERHLYVEEGRSSFLKKRTKKRLLI